MTDYMNLAATSFPHNQHWQRVTYIQSTLYTVLPNYAKDFYICCSHPWKGIT